MDAEDSAEPLVMTLPRKGIALSRIRRWAAAALADLIDEDRQAVVLVVNELVSNAYEHGDGASQLRLRRTGGHHCPVRVEVDDDATAPPTLGRSRLNSNRGRGLVIVQALSWSWGFELRQRGKTVWATVRCAGV